MSEVAARATNLIQEAQSIQNQLAGDRPIVSESRKMRLAAMQVEATALVARAVSQVAAILASDPSRA